MATKRTEFITKQIRSSRTASISTVDLPPVTICLVIYNSQAWLEVWFVGILASGYPHHLLTLNILDNASTDNSLKTLKGLVETHQFQGLVTYFEKQTNLGFGAGQDILITSAITEFVLNINPDAVLQEGSLLEAIKFAQRDDADVCAWEFAQFPFEHPKYYDPVTLETSWNSHACVLLRRAAYVDVGGYDKAIFMYGEDVDLSYRFRLMGYRLRYLPWIRVKHDSDSIHGARPEQSFRIIAGNLCLRRRYGTIYDKFIGYLIALRCRFSGNVETKASISKAWALYKEMRLHFRKKENQQGVRFPFNGLEYDRFRPSIDVKLGSTQTIYPKITVITRIHKQTSVLGEALQTVLNQTYPNIEHIVVFDNCPPYSISNQKVVEGDFETRSEAANAGANIATGEFFLFLDYDDLLFADHLEGLHGVFDEHPNAVAAYGVSWEAATLDRESPGDASMDLQLGMEAMFSPEEILNHNFFAIQSVLVRKEAFMQVGGFDVSLDELEDWNLWKRLLEIGEFRPNLKVTSIYFTPGKFMTRYKRLLDLTE